MMFEKICLAVLCLGAVFAEPPVNNQYLPPSNGYNYPKPSQPFPPAPRPPAPPAPRPPQPTYGPPAPRPSYGPPAPPAPRPPQPTYGPPAPPAPRPTPQYSPPAPAPTYGPPSPPRPAPPRPSYGPPTGGTNYNPIPQGPQNTQYPGGNQGHEHHDDHHVHEPGMPFDFNYAVKDDYYGTDYSHNAVSDGDVVRGEYKVLLPDGRLQIVTYTADWKNGFNADVKYQGEPQYPQQQQQQGGRPNAGGTYAAPPQTGSGPY